LVDTIDTQLSRMFSCRVIPKGEKEPSKEALDSYRRQYDVRYLVKELPSENPSLWVMVVDIADANHMYLYGAASKTAAVVSAFHSGDGVNLLKEACHEAGHLFGLEHCSQECVMRPSRSIFQLERKKLTLCENCRSKLSKEVPAKIPAVADLRREEF